MTEDEIVEIGARAMAREGWQGPYQLAVTSEQLMRAALTALHEAGLPTDKLADVMAGRAVIVPVISTKRMDEIGAAEVRAYDHRLGDTDGVDSREVCASEVYRAMIHAAGGDNG